MKNFIKFIISKGAEVLLLNNYYAKQLNFN